MVNLELFNIVDEIRKVSKAFVVHPKNVNAENATSKIFVLISVGHIELKIICICCLLRFFFLFIVSFCVF